MKLQRLVPVVVMTVSLLVPLTGLAADAAPKAAPASTAKPLPDPVARVNGMPISASDFTKATKALTGPNGGQVPAGKEQELRQFVLGQLISAELLYQMASKTPVPDLDKKVEDGLARLKARFKTEEEYRKGLTQQDMQEKELRELIRRNEIIKNHIDQTFVAKVVVSDQEVREFYDKNPETFTMPEQLRARHILITVDPKASDADKKKARTKAEELLKQLKAGADFDKLARENSGCPSSKNGGDLGYFSKGQMVKPFEDAAWALKPGELSGVVETQFGYHIIKLTEKRAPDKIPFDSIKARIAENLKQRKVGEQVSAALDAAKKAAKIETYLN